MAQNGLGRRHGDEGALSSSGWARFSSIANPLEELKTIERFVNRLRMAGVVMSIFLIWLWTPLDLLSTYGLALFFFLSVITSFLVTGRIQEASHQRALNLATLGADVIFLGGLSICYVHVANYTTWVIFFPLLTEAGLKLSIRGTLAVLATLVGLYSVIEFIRGTVFRYSVTFQGIAFELGVLLATGVYVGYAAQLAKRRQQMIEKIAQENATLYERAYQLAITDGITGVYSRRYLNEFLKREIALAKRERSPVGLLIADLDTFKEVNDTYGHVAGDRVLAEVAGRIVAALRATDFVARYGGDEFVIVLPGCEAEWLAKCADKIRHLVKTQNFVVGEGATAIDLTLSVGGGSYPSHASDADDLIHKADQALFKG